MASAFEKTVSATEFKAKCLELMEDGAQRRLDRIHITKRGKPFVTLEVKAEADPTADALDSIFGFMKGRTILPDDWDWDAPRYSEAELDAMDARFNEKFKDYL